MTQPAWWEEVLSLSHSAYLHISREQRIIDALGDTQTLLARDPSALIGMALSELKDIRAQLGGAVAESLARREIRPGETWGFEDGAGSYYGLADGSFVIKLTSALKVDQGIVGRLADQLPVLVTYIDQDLRFRLTNQAYENFIGIDRETLYGQPIATVMDDGSYAQIQPRLDRVLAGEDVTFEDHLTLADGRAFYFKVHYIPDFLEGEVIGFYAIVQDISEYRAIIQLLRDVHSGVNRTDIGTDEIIDHLLRDALTYLSLDIGLVSRIIDEQYIVKWAASDIADISTDDTFELGNTYCRLMLDAGGIYHTAEAGKDPRVSGHPCYQAFGLESYIGAPLRLNGEIWGTLNFSSAQPRQEPFDQMEIELVRLIADAVERVITDEAELEQVRQELDRMADKALRDYLTGLPNRAYLDQHVETLIQAHDTRDEPFSLAVLDIDHFKQVNDRHGHDAGDAVLQWLSGRVSECLREGDTVARTGGEEFVVVMRGTRAPEAASAMERVREHVSAGGVTLESGQRLGVTVSGGVSEHIAGESFSNLFKRADTALYTAKRSGRDLVSSL
ncbi:Response regulator PleD [Halomonas sp. THAF12]|uniref:sensor domain-containing diguanylate cyclase n=1 Tax=Halomonas sp. THAF12 TaxID=2587849 RepID=UPI0012689E48|nr:diguanylate cyclase [Halomonas sp. THAF12]QFT83607.1 Response regulator PleD [Halomonas sp. THAF12]